MSSALEALAASTVAADPDIHDMTTAVATFMAEAARLYPAEWQVFERRAVRAAAAAMLGRALRAERRALAIRRQREITEQRAANLVATGSVGDAHYPARRASHSS